jgi:hypothetical protein
MRLSVRRKGAERKEEIQRVCVCEEGGGGGGGGEGRGEEEHLKYLALPKITMKQK